MKEAIIEFIQLLILFIGMVAAFYFAHAMGW